VAANDFFKATSASEHRFPAWKIFSGGIFFAVANYAVWSEVATSRKDFLTATFGSACAAREQFFSAVGTVPAMGAYAA
jgi:hypothetical protein